MNDDGLITTTTTMQIFVRWSISVNGTKSKLPAGSIDTVWMQ